MLASEIDVIVRILTLMSFWDVLHIHWGKWGISLPTGRTARARPAGRVTNAKLTAAS